MVKIEAVIRPDKIDEVRRAIEAVGYPGVMVTELKGHGRQKGLQAGWPEDLREYFLPKTKLEIVVGNLHQERVIKAILGAARTGEIGDGKIFVYDIKDAVRIRTGERGIKAVSMRSDSVIVRHRGGKRRGKGA